MTQLNDEKVLPIIFNEKGTNLIKYLRLLEKDLPTYTYKFIPIEEYKQLSDIKEMQKIYWFELLERAHWASITTIYRTLGWVNGTSNAYISNNYLLFSAAYRGFLESSADSFYTLLKIPKAFAIIYQEVNLALNGSFSQKMIINKELEDSLIHFSYARSRQTKKKDEEVTGIIFPDIHVSETIRKYIDSFGDGLKERIHTCYSFLCDSTHPGMTSVWMYIGTVNQDLKIRGFSDKEHFEKSLLEKFCSDYVKTSEEILMLIFNLTMITLKVINTFNVPELYTPAVNNLSMNHTKLWQDIKEYLPSS